MGNKVLNETKHKKYDMIGIEY